MRALVTGGAGFIGSHLCDLLLAEGHSVICVDNFITSNVANIQHLMSRKSFELVNHDITKPLPIDGSIDYVLHLASPASPIDYQKLPLETLKVGSFGTLNALELAREKKARFLLASTSEVYGDPCQHPQKEEYWGNVNPIGVRSVYDEAKRFAEALTMAYHRQFGLDTRIVRIFNTYGPRMRENDGRVIPTFIPQALAGKPLTVFGDGLQTRSLCFISDLVEGINKLALAGPNLPVNLGNPEEITMLELAQRIRRITGSESRVVYQALPEDEPKRRCPDISRAREMLGWSPRVSLEEGLRKTVEWFESNRH